MKVRNRSRLVLLLICIFHSTVDAHPLDGKCKAVAAQEVKGFEKHGVDYTLITWNGFYASKIDACIATEVKDVGNYFEIWETSDSFFKGTFKGLFQCGDDGARVADIDAIRKLGGRVDRVSYPKWNHDGYGGPPNTDVMPDKPYSKTQCQALFDNMIKQIR